MIKILERVIFMVLAFLLGFIVGDARVKMKIRKMTLERANGMSKKSLEERLFCFFYFAIKRRE